MRFLTHTFLLAAAISASSVIHAAMPVNNSLESNEWQLESYADASCQMQRLLPKSSIHAIFADGKLHGGGGCNQYSAEYSSTQENKLSISDRIASTMMACTPPVSRQEQHYLSLLPKATHYQIKDDALLLMNAENHLILHFVAHHTATLENTRWQAGGINNGKGGVVSSTATHMATARFEEGKVSGNAGCNNFSASYTVSDESLTIGPAMTTRKLCAEPAGIMDQERQYLQALQKTHTYKLERDRLQLRDGKGSLLVQFVVDASGN
jgi:heat shock protein HslJ